jgi:hypothetical protein
MLNTPLHPAVVHIPLGLVFVLPLLAAGLTAALYRGHVSRAAFSILLGLQLVMLGGGALTAGEAAVERHEAAAQQFMVVAGLGAALTALAWALRNPRHTRAMAVATTLGTLAAAGMGVRVGHLGGELVYGPRGVAAQGPTAAAGGEAGGNDNDDD